MPAWIPPKISYDSSVDFCMNFSKFEIDLQFLQEILLGSLQEYLQEFPEKIV